MERVEVPHQACLLKNAFRIRLAGAGSDPYQAFKETSDNSLNY